MTPILDPVLFRKWREGDTAAGRELAEGFWDRQYLRKFGSLLKDFLTPRPPLPVTPAESVISQQLIEQAAFQNELLGTLLGSLAGDPSPQPSLVALISDPEPRIRAAENLLGAFKNASKEIEKDIVQLKKRS